MRQPGQADDHFQVTFRDRLRKRRRQLSRTRELARQLERVRALLDAGRAVNSARELDDVLQTILNGAVTLLGASTGSVMLRDGVELVVVAASGNARALHRRVPIGDAIAGRVAVSRRPQVVQGRASASRFPGLAERGMPIDSGMSVPMVDRNELVGVLNVGAVGTRAFEDDDVDLLCAFAEHAATAIAKARLYEAARRATAELAYSATHDALTSLPNRTLLADRVTDAIRDAVADPHGALLFMDIDGFKAVNDAYGHPAGDEVLCAVAARVRSVAPVGSTPARIGGDELALFAPDVVDSAEAEALAAAVVTAVRPGLSIERGAISVTASVGIALVGRHGSTYADLMRAADSALYEAKRAGRNCWRMSRITPLAVAGDTVPRQRRRWSNVAGASHADH
jgi:diguanylate cyclase (GGDEF)-like protein